MVPPPSHLVPLPIAQYSEELVGPLGVVLGREFVVEISGIFAVVAGGELVDVLLVVGVFVEVAIVFVDDGGLKVVLLSALLVVLIGGDSVELVSIVVEGISGSSVEDVN